ncbi:SF3a splicing factor complex subunit [Kappamyces sp. JEL0680]|nr:SF3a splicing factor complex subunit [Kappamyces sp. JEL0680]
MKRVEYEAYMKGEKEKAQIEADKEKIAFATIDWHDFVVVETIEFLETDARAVLPQPMVLMELKSMTLEQRKALMKFDVDQNAAADGEEDMDVDDGEDMDMSEEDQPAPAPAQPAADAAPARNTYVPKVGRHAKSQVTQVCPVCNATVKVSEMQEHVRIELQDPRYREKRAALDAKQMPSNLVAEGDVVAANLKRMTNFRSDIFGSGAAGEATQAQRIAFEADKQKESQRNKVIWDGHAKSAPLVQAQMQAIAAQTPSSQPPPPPPVTGPMLPGKQKAMPPPPAMPDVKRLKIANANALVLTIQVPDREPIVFNDLTPMWTVSQLKDKLAPLCGLTSGKQKLVTASGTVLKNAFTLHDSGLASGDVITLQTKERSKK